MRAKLAAIGIGGCMLAATPALAAGEQCAALAGHTLGDHGKIESAATVPAAAGAPAFCEVQAVLTPVAGSRIGVVYRLPADWNGKILGLGGGGWAGNVVRGAALPGLARGYAVAQTDGGHASTSLWDNGWVANPEAAKDFSYRAIHEMTLAAKQLVRSYYGRAQARTYYQGCSTGGRMGLMEAQRFPTDYDGIIAGAPVYTLQVQTSALLRNKTFAAPGAAFTPAQFALVNAAVLKACGNGRDAYLADPRACGWQPGSLQCKAGQAADSCLTPAQVEALRVAYAGIRTPEGSWAALPLEKGGELGWSRFITTAGGTDVTRGGGMIGLKPLLFGDAPVDLVNLRADQDVTRARSSAFAKMYEAGDPDITAFTGGGGKLILWHGESDPGPSPVGTIDYYEAVVKQHPQAAANVRLFLAPGVEHCGGGPGPDRPDTLTALEQWVERGQAPATVIATRADGSATRPLCPFPAQARYSGTGDVNDPRSYRCS